MRVHRFLILLICSPLLIASLAGSDPLRPNILYVYVDDMGWGSLGPNGQFERKAKGLPHLITPALDQLASESVTFARSYGCTVCSPARSSQQTGFHQGHTFADRNDRDNAKKAIRKDDLTMGDMLSQAGYMTGYWGKWGYGGSQEKDPNPRILNVETLPTSHGYEHVVAELHHVRAHTFFQPTLWKAPALPGSKGGLELVPNSMARYRWNPAYPSAPALQNHPDYPEIAYCDDVYAFAALDFIRIQAQNYNATGQPFFGLLACQIPHAPFDEVRHLPDWDKAYRDKPWFKDLPDQAKEWAAMITRIDAHFGNLLKALEDPNGDGDMSDSVADNTLILFQSDNGGPGGPSRTEFASNAHLSGNKGGIQEGGIRVPLMMRLPKSFQPAEDLQPGSRTDRIIDVTDLLPTFCELAGVDSPLGLDGVSLAPALAGKGYQRVRKFLIHEAGNGQSIIRDDYKLVRSKEGLSLFDLSKDPSESRDISKKHPGLVKELEALMLAERVDEPKGFANTYHRWTGVDGGNLSKGANWSDYVYANDGVAHLVDKGDPRVSWIGRLENGASKPSTAKASSDAAFLALQIGGGMSHQALLVSDGVAVVGRNEVRVANNGSLRLDGGEMSSMRWIDIKDGGRLSGFGQIGGTLINGGRVACGSGAANGIRVASDYIELEGSHLNLSCGTESEARLEVAGKAQLAGRLSLSTDADARIKPGSGFTILTAKSVVGRFSNTDDVVVTDNGTRFKIHYGESEVSVVAL